MYDFLLSEVWWMETIWSALIVGGCSLVGSLIGFAAIYSYKLKLMAKNTEELLKREEAAVEKRNALSSEHTGMREKLTEQYNSIAKTESNLLGGAQRVETAVNAMNKRFIEEKSARMERQRILGGNEQMLVNSASKIGEFSEAYLMLLKENKELRTENEILIAENKRIVTDANQFQDERDSILTVLNKNGIRISVDKNNVYYVDVEEQNGDYEIEV